MRLFLALNLEPEVRRGVADATASLRAEVPELGWVAEGRLHLTLKFLGEQPEERVGAIRSALDDVARRHRAFALRVGGTVGAVGVVGVVGAFPNFRRARVVWMGVSADPRLELLHHDVEVACEALGFALEGRAFRPHLTLARVRERVAPDVLRRLSRAGKRVSFDAESLVQSVDVMHSVRGASARYERLHAAPLRAS